MNGNHQAGPNCPCQQILVMDEHPIRCSCGGYYHLLCGEKETSIRCDICNKDRHPYPEGKLVV